jgi:hypothetical protein
MRRAATLPLAVGALLLGLSFSTAQAIPALGEPPPVAASNGPVEKVQFRCVRRCLRYTGLPPWACRRRCFARCAPPRKFSGFCTQMVVWARNPRTGACCRYPNPCSIPRGYRPSCR